MLPMITEFPIPVCDRLSPVPAADLTWVNHKWGKDYPTLAKDEHARSKGRIVSGLRGTYPLLSKPIHLKSGNASTFPSTDDFILARAEIGEGGVVPATLRNLDLKILDNHVGYSRMPGGEAYYFQKNLQLPCETKGGVRQYIGRFYLSVFTERGQMCNSIHAIIDTFVCIRSNRTGKEEVDKACLNVMMWLAQSIYGVLNKRFLLQDPVEGSDYDEAAPPFVDVFFEQRECSTQLDFENKVLRPALANYKTLDMAKFATEHNFAEFFWLCCGFARCIAEEMKVEIFPEAFVTKFCKNDFHEHWANYLTQSHVREVKIPELPDLLNSRSTKLSACPLASSKFSVKAPGARATKKNFTTVNKWRVTNSRTKTPSLQFGKAELQTINWPGYLAKYSLLVWSYMDPTRACWDMSHSYFKYRYSDPQRFVQDVGVALFLVLHGSFNVNAGDKFKPHPDAFPPVNTVRLSYSMIRNEAKRLCITPPLAISSPSLVAPSITSPLNIQYPCWKWLLESVIKTEAPGLEDAKRRRQPLCKYAADKDMVPVGDGSELYLATQDAAIKEVFGPPKLDLLWRVQMVRNTGFFDLYPMRHTLLRDPEPPADFDAQPPWQSPAQPTPGTFDMAAYRQAAYMRLNKHTGLSGDTGDLCDQPVNCWNLYRAYLQGCVLYVNEIDVVRHVLVVAFGSVSGFMGACQKGWADVFNGMLISLQWGERLWRSLLYTSTIDGVNDLSAPVARQVRKKFLQLYPVHRLTGSVPRLVQEMFFKNTQPQVSESALLQRPEFWKDLLQQYRTIIDTGDTQVDAADLHELLQEVAKGETDATMDDMQCKVILRSHILPVHHGSSWTMCHENKSPMAIYSTKSGLFPALRAIATRRFVQPLCLLASTLFPSTVEVMRYVSPLDGQSYKWNQLKMPNEKDPLIFSIARQFSMVAKAAIAQDDVDWKEEIKSVQRQGSAVSSATLLAMATLFTNAAVATDGPASSSETKTAKKTKKTKKAALPIPAPPASDKDREAFIDMTKAEGMRLTIDRVAQHIFITSLSTKRPQGQPHFIDAAALGTVIALYNQSIPGLNLVGAERLAFDMLRKCTTEAQLICSLKKLGDVNPVLLNKFQMHNAAKNEQQQQQQQQREVKKPVAALPKAPDPTASKRTQPAVEDFEAEDAEASETRFMIAGLSQSLASNSKRPAPDATETAAAAKRHKTETSCSSSNSAEPPQRADVMNKLVWGNV